MSLIGPQESLQQEVRKTRKGATAMKKERLFPYWTDLSQVIPVVQSQTVNAITMTLVSIETYSQQGFLVTVNVKSNDQNAMFDRLGRGWARAQIVDHKGNRYTSLLAMILGQTYNHLFSGRAVMICMPGITDTWDGLIISIDAIEWEYTDGPEDESSSEILPGPWKFNVST